MNEKASLGGDGSAARPVTGGGAGEAARVVRRLERIEALDREGAPAGQLLGELRELVHEAEAWAQVDAGGRSRDAVTVLGPVRGDEAGGVEAMASAEDQRTGGTSPPAGAGELEATVSPGPERKVREEVEGMR
jgi:hypothetical protein